MVRRRDLITGKFYVDRGYKIAREVLRISRQTITFNTYHLDTGNSCGTPSECLIDHFVRWASREVLPGTLAFLQDLAMEAEFSASAR